MTMYFVENENETIKETVENLKEAKKMAKAFCKETKQDIWVIDVFRDIEKVMYSYENNKVVAY